MDQATRDALRNAALADQDKDECTLVRPSTLLRLLDAIEAYQPVVQAAVAFVGCESHADVDHIMEAVAALEPSAVQRLNVAVDQLGKLKTGLAKAHAAEQEKWGHLADCTRDVLIATAHQAWMECDRFKELAALLVSVIHRLDTKCTACRGAGMVDGRDGMGQDPCRACNQTGKLSFVEDALALVGK